MTSQAFALKQIGQVSISVKDIERAVTFYRDVLGISLLFQVPGMAFLDCGGVRLCLAVPESPEFDRTSILYYRVPSMADATHALEARGVRFVQPAHVIHQDDRHELWMAFFKDTEGNHLALMSEVQTA